MFGKWKIKEDEAPLQLPQAETPSDILHYSETCICLDFPKEALTPYYL